MLIEAEISSPPMAESDTRDLPERSNLKYCDAEFEQLEFTQIPEGHPVAAFAQSYFPLINGFLLPDVKDVISSAEVQKLGNWVQILEPVRRGLRLDFHTLPLGEQGGQKDDSKPQWLADAYEGDFAVPRFQEAVVASVLREPLFSRGTVPSRSRYFIRQYRGVFPLFAENQSRLCLAVVAAETFLSVNPEER